MPAPRGVPQERAIAPRTESSPQSTMRALSPRPTKSICVAAEFSRSSIRKSTFRSRPLLYKCWVHRLVEGRPEVAPSREIIPCTTESLLDLVGDGLAVAEIYHGLVSLRRWLLNR